MAWESVRVVPSSNLRETQVRLESIYSVTFTPHLAAVIMIKSAAKFPTLLGVYKTNAAPEDAFFEETVFVLAGFLVSFLSFGFLSSALPGLVIFLSV